MTRPIVDSHHHFWRQQDQPWLVGPMIPRIFGPYEPIRRDYPIQEFLEDQSHANVVRSVYVQTNWAPQDYEKEAAWVQQTADAAGWPHAAVFYADMLGEDVRPQLEVLMKYPLIRGVRMQLHWHDTPAFRFAPVRDAMNDSRFRRNISRLRDYGLSFDLQVFSGQMVDTARMVAEHPETPFVLVHAGMLEDGSAAGVAAWQAGMSLLAAQANLNVKLSGLGTFLHRNDPAHVAFVVRDCVQRFGAERCMFGSNFPIEKIWTDHQSLLQAHLDALAPFSEAQQDSVLRGTASRVYRLS